ncbi:MAG: B12-binding domain-containing radical SAM protein [Promethearchaeia archaeon]
MTHMDFTELNVIRKNAQKVDVLFGYCYPSTYRTGMTNLSTHLFYTMLNARKDTSCERYFRYDVPSPSASLESGRPLKENHIVGFSLTYEQNITAILEMLAYGDIPLLAKNRREKDPLVLLGGVVVTSNPEPYRNFADAFVVGEGDQVIHDIIEAVPNATSRNEAIDNLADIGGVYVPSSAPSVVRRIQVDNLDSLFYPQAQIIPNVTDGSKYEPVFGKAFLLETSRGCGHACGFCLIGHLCRPRRTRSLRMLKNLVEKGLHKTPVRKVALIASSLGDRDNVEELTSWIVKQGLSLSVPSLRADSVTRDLLSAIVAGGQRTLTIAPETGSEELRQQIGKGLTDEDIFRAVSLAEKAGFTSVKLYFIIGLPHETAKDIKAIIQLVRKLAKQSQVEIKVNVNPFVPKAGTGFQRYPQPPLDILRRKTKEVGDGLNQIPNVRCTALDVRGARIQAALSLGDSRISEVIRLATRYGGYGGWRRAETETGIEFFSIANNAERLKGELPWSFIMP